MINPVLKVLILMLMMTASSVWMHLVLFLLQPSSSLVHDQANFKNCSPTIQRRWQANVGEMKLLASFCPSFCNIEENCMGSTRKMSYSKSVNNTVPFVKGLKSNEMYFYYLLILEQFDNIFCHLAKLLSKRETVNFCV